MKRHPLINLAASLPEDVEKVKLVHDYLTNTIQYVAGSPYNQSAYSAIVFGITVCAGYAHAFQYCMQKLGIPAAYIVGYAGEAHAWNLLQLGGEYYCMDVTWDDPLGNPPTTYYYNYFNITDAQISKDHTRTRFPRSFLLPTEHATALTRISAEINTARISRGLITRRQCPPTTPQFPRLQALPLRLTRRAPQHLTPRQAPQLLIPPPAQQLLIPRQAPQLLILRRATPRLSIPSPIILFPNILIPITPSPTTPTPTTISAISTIGVTRIGTTIGTTSIIGSTTTVTTISTTTTTMIGKAIITAMIGVMIGIMIGTTTTTAGIITITAGKTLAAG